MDPLLLAGSVVAAYLLGSVPTGVLVGKVWRGVDIRRYGSGSSGSTNMFRTLGAFPATVLVLLDVGKAVLAVGLAWLATDGDDLGRALAGVAVVAGHSWPIFSRFHGGRGVMTGWGAMIVLSPIAAAITAVGWVIVWVTRYVSVGSMLGTAVGLVTMIVLVVLDRLPIEYLIFAVLAALMIFARHLPNIVRLFGGREKQVTEPGHPTRARTRHS